MALLLAIKRNELINENFQPNAFVHGNILPTRRIRVYRMCTYISRADSSVPVPRWECDEATTRNYTPETNCTNRTHTHPRELIVPRSD